MLTNHQSYSNLMAPNPMAYVINSPVANSVLNQAKSQLESTLQEQLGRMQEQNNTLARKLHNKTTEYDKLHNKVEKLETELHTYKQVIEQLKHSLANGNPPIDAINLTMQRAFVMAKAHAKKTTTKKGKNAPNCQCCYVAEKPYLCEWENCGKRFRQKQHLEAHRNVHTGRRFSCDWPDCGKSFCRKFNLVEHAKMHTNGNPNLCTYPGCGKTFSSKYGLIRHQNAQHSLNI